MVVAAGAEAKRLDLDVFMPQSSESARRAPGWSACRGCSSIDITHPMPVRRVHGLMAWVRSGDYDRIVGGSYTTREEPPNRARRRPRLSRTMPSASGACSATPATPSAIWPTSSLTCCARAAICDRASSGPRAVLRRPRRRRAMLSTHGDREARQLHPPQGREQPAYRLVVTGSGAGLVGSAESCSRSSAWSAPGCRSSR